MKTYYELMMIMRRDGDQDGFKDISEVDEQAQKVEIDSESQTVATALGIIRWLLKNDESVKGKYVFKKEK